MSRLPPKVLRSAVLLILASALTLGWWLFLFTTDDAYITFRYIDHHRRGWGYTWNPPPFRPVEGYSNFLWMVLLEAVWALTGVAPPKSCNVVSLILSYGSLALGLLMVWRAPLPERWRPWRFWLMAAVGVSAVVNRTFLTWTSSGLETALFVLCTTAWVFGALEVGRRCSPRWLLVASSGAALAALTRPDGLLWVVTTAGLAAYLFARRAPTRATLLGLSPLALVPVHLLWRRAYYGEWVPNTYFAKHVTAWPDAGARFTASFILEHAVWAWFVLAAVLVVLWLRNLERKGLEPRAVSTGVPALLVGLAFTAHVAYYTFVIGGDHFEYRVYAHLVLPLGLALARMVVLLPLRPRWSFVVFAAVIALGLPIPWVHWAKTHDIESRDATFKMFVPIRRAFPKGPLREYARAFDSLQEWMQARHVGTRHQEHKIFLLTDQMLPFPKREVGEKVKWTDGHPVYSIATVGYPGWTMPEIAIIDFHGLNDRVVARTPIKEVPAVRLMAHERTPPPGYVDCFLPNVSIADKKPVVAPRKQPLTEEMIRSCEARFEQRQ